MLKSLLDLRLWCAAVLLAAGVGEGYAIMIPLAACFALMGLYDAVVKVNDL